ncbi:MAG: aminoacyl-tRNA hydrolase [Betaproteobacteria bacterium]|nr:aminoacyl-tRNA hydrolase [Betaproteobacteria bacterium]
MRSPDKNAAIRLVVGLGNPGPDHESDRHNAGFWFLDRLQQQYDPHAAFLLKPSTWMNRSGQAVLALSHFYKIQTDEILVAHDELDLLPGVAKLKFGGGSAGHNGLKDISQRLASDHYWRLRIGIGHPRSLNLEQAVGDFVLHRPAQEQRAQIDTALLTILAQSKAFLLGERERAIAMIHRALPGKSTSSPDDPSRGTGQAVDQGKVDPNSA